MTTKLSLSELLERANSGEKIAIHTPTEQQAIILLTELDKKGYVWVDRDKLTIKTIYEDEKENTCYSFYYRYGRLLDKKVLYCSLKYFQDVGYTIIEFTDIDFEEK